MGYVAAIVVICVAGMLLREFGGYVKDVSPENFMEKGEQEDGRN